VGMGLIFNTVSLFKRYRHFVLAAPARYRAAR